uniref:Uncharacterized protein n=1 Tax=Romanomermis culicivorax TaxID=13658 RepID=A0A915J3A9_ROMCU
MAPKLEDNDIAIVTSDIKFLSNNGHCPNCPSNFWTKVFFDPWLYDYIKEKKTYDGNFHAFLITCLGDYETDDHTRSFIFKAHPSKVLSILCWRSDMQKLRRYVVKTCVCSKDDLIVWTLCNDRT